VTEPDHPVRLADLVVQWRPDWLCAAVLLGLAALYVRGRVRLRRGGRPWPVRRDVGLGVGLLLALWVTCGFPQARGSQLMWVWTGQVLLLLLVVPVVLVTAQPVALARSAYGPRSPLLRLLESRVVRWLGHPALTLLYVPVVTGLLFFGGVGEASLRSTPAGWLLHLVLLAIGAMIALPLLDVEDSRTSLAVGVAVAVSAVELLLDAVPGIVLRLETHLQMPAFAAGRPAWAPGALADQQTAGAILWTVAELLDLPYLVLTVRQWTRLDRREAQRIDADLDRAAAGADPGPGPGSPAAVGRPWWLDDPELRRRYGGG
jgi:putative membrane protein